MTLEGGSDAARQAQARMAVSSRDGAISGSELRRVPKHVGFIPDGNRRWADARDLSRAAGYEAGVEPGLRLMEVCTEIGIEEVSIYGFTRENALRSSEQVEAFRSACMTFARRAVDAGAALRVIGDSRSRVFPEALRSFTRRRGRGDIRVNLLVNYAWQWDLYTALRHAHASAALAHSALPSALASGAIPRVDLVVRWGGRRRLSGFLPVQCAYADLYFVDTLWPDSTTGEFLDALAWYQDQDVTLGG